MSDNDDDYMCEEEEDYGLVGFYCYCPLKITLFVYIYHTVIK